MSRLACRWTKSGSYQSLRVLLCLLVMLSLDRANALDPSRHIFQYGHTAWRVQDGFFNGPPNAIAQTTDGYIWIGTDSGLLRFDGVRFVPWNGPPGQQLPSGQIESLLGTKDGGLWIGGSGVSLWKNAKLTSYPIAGRINAILEDSNGEVWIVRSRVGADQTGPLCRLTNSRFHCYGNADGIAFPTASTVASDPAGKLWIGSASSLAEGKPGSFNTLNFSQLRSHESLSGIEALASGPDGTMFVGMGFTGPGLGLQQLANGQLTPFLLPHLDGTTLQVGALLADRDGTLWVGTENKGILRIRGDQVDEFGGANGLSGGSAEAFLEDHEGNLWVLTSGGLDCFRDVKIATFPSRQGLSSVYASSVLASRDGTVWVGNHDALDALHDDEVSSLRAADGLPGQRVTALLEDHLGRLWVGADNALSVRENGVFHKVTRPDGSAVGAISALVEDQKGDIWADPIPSGTRLVRIHGFVVSNEVLGSATARIAAIAADPVEGIWIGLEDGTFGRYKGGNLQFVRNDIETSHIRILTVMPDGSLWRIASGKMIGWREGSSRQLSRENGLPCELINSFLLARSGTLWIYAECGLIEIQDAELQRWWKDPDARLQFRLFDTFDGVQSAPAVFNPKAAESVDGRVWFVNDSVVQMVDPSNLSGNPLAPPVHIEEVLADRKSHSPVDGLRLPPLTRDLEIDYTALSFVVPRKVRFRYKLMGHDTDWQEPGSRRQAFYNDLAPGKYRFQVIACNNDGVWNQTGDTLNFVIVPAFYQTVWFKTLLWAMAAALLWLLYSLRLRRVTDRMQGRLEERLSERERIARELHDTLLQGFQGLMLRFQTAIDEPDHARSRTMMERALDRADEVLLEGRQRVNALRTESVTVNELSEALAAYGEELNQQHRLTFRMTLAGSPAPLDLLVRDDIFRIGREALMNAFQHSGASQIEAEVSYDRAMVRLRIRDNGRGMDESVLAGGRPGHWGLFGMRERAKNIGAELKIWSRPDTGTEIDLAIPGNIVYQNGHSGLDLRRLWRGKPPQVKE